MKVFPGMGLPGKYSREWDYRERERMGSRQVRVLYREDGRGWIGRDWNPRMKDPGNAGKWVYRGERILEKMYLERYCGDRRARIEEPGSKCPDQSARIEGPGSKGPDQRAQIGMYIRFFFFKYSYLYVYICVHHPDLPNIWWQQNRFLTVIYCRELWETLKLTIILWSFYYASQNEVWTLPEYMYSSM